MTKGKTQLYHQIFVNNVSLRLKELGMTKTELARRSGVSVSYLSDLTTVGKANPSLKIMARIAEIIDVPLPRLLEQNPVTLPEGYEHVSVVLPKHQAFIVKKWVKVARANNISEKSVGWG